MALPPRETAHIETSHLAFPDARETWWHRVLGQVAQISQTAPFDVRLSLTFPSATISMKSFALATTPLLLAGGLLFVMQPSSPKLTNSQTASLQSYLEQTNGPTTPVAVASNTIQNPNPQAPATTNPTASGNDSTNKAELADSANNPTDIDLTAAPPTAPDRAYRYYLTLSQGFLQKSIALSQSTQNQTQTAEQKQQIVDLLGRALVASNKAVEINSTNGIGFLMRAKVYNVASAINPEFAKMSQQDKEIAQALGVSGDAFASENILDFLPTEQATDLAGGPIIAAPEASNSSTVTTNVADNAVKSTALLKANENTIYVEFPGLTTSQALSVRVADNSPFKPNTSYIIASRVEGQGFRISANATWDKDVLLEWQAVNQ